MGEPSLVNRVISAKTAFAPDGKIHGTATAGMASGGTGVPVREIPGERHLESAQYADIEVPAAHHREGSGVIEIDRAPSLGDWNLAGIDQVRIDVSAVRRGPTPNIPSRCARSPHYRR